MKKTIIFTSFLAVFLMLMIPNVNAVEYRQVEETKEAFMKNQWHLIQENLPIDCVDDLKIPSDTFLINFDDEQISKKIENISFENSFFKRITLFGDPGNGTDGNGPDDWTDYLYLCIYLLLYLPVSFLEYLVPFLSEFFLNATLILISLVRELFSLFEPVFSLLASVLDSFFSLISEIIKHIPGARFIIFWLIIGVVILLFIYLFYFFTSSLFQFISSLILVLLSSFFDIFIGLISLVIVSIGNLYMKSYQEAYDIIDWNGDGR